MSGIIEVRGLEKTYQQGKRNRTKTARKALRDLNLSIKEGAVFGFIGPNGAGKTTTMRILTTLLEPSGGEAWVAGHSISKDARGIRRVMGYMPDFFGVYDDMKVWEYLDFFAACYGIPAHDRLSLSADLLALVDLDHRGDDMVDSLSRGMKQRLCLARTLVHDPLVLVLDEPASGLDPRARIEIRELLRELQKMGKTIFFSSHILSEVADICTHIGVIEAGDLVAAGSMEEMQRHFRPQRIIRVRVLGGPQKVQEVLLSLSGVENIRLDTASKRENSSEILFDLDGDDASLSSILSSLVAHQLGVVSFSEDSGDLEDVFLTVTQGIVS